MALIGSRIQRDEVYKRNASHVLTLLASVRELNAIAELGGGEAAKARHHERGKLTARERVQKLIDPGSRFVEIGILAGQGQYAEYGGAPAAGTVVGIGLIHGRTVVIVANDATVKAGAWFPITCKKNLRAQEIAMENRIPVIYLVDSAGVFLPLQSDIFPDREHFGRIFRNNAILSAMGVTQIAAIMGPCVAGGAYLPIMSDEALIVDKTGSVFLAGSHLVKAAVGEEIDNESLGGARVHCEISGVTDHKVANDEECLEKIRSIMSKIGATEKATFNRDVSVDPAYPAEEMLGILPDDRTRPYDMYQVLARIIDGSNLDEYKAGYGKTLITGYARVDGWAVGIVASQRSVVKTAKGELQVGGVIYSDSADKAARFVLNCNQKKIPLVFFQDVTGFMVGSRAEQGGIIKDGAKLVNAVANSVVPKFTFIIGNSYGAGNYALCGKAYDPRLIFAWPTAQIAVMGGRQAGETLLSIKMQALGKNAEKASTEEVMRLQKELLERYERELDPVFAASRLWVDDVIDPLRTRSLISLGIGLAAHNPHTPHFTTGVFQV